MQQKLSRVQEADLVMQDTALKIAFAQGRDTGRRDT